MLPPFFRDDAADFRRRAIAIVRAQLHQQRHAVRPVNLVGQILESARSPPPVPFLDGALDVVVGHVGRRGI